MNIFRRGRTALFLFFTAGLLLVSGPISRAAGDESSSWLTGPLYLNKVADIQPAGWPSTVFSAGNVDCANLVPGKCLIDTPYGALAGSSLFYNSKWYPIADAGGSFARLQPIPDSGTAFTTSGSSLGNFLYFNRGVGLVPKYKYIPDIIPAEKLLDHFQVASPPQNPLADKSGRPLQVDINSLAYSGNSEWMVATGNNTATLRVNLDTGDVLPFGKQFIYGGGNPMPMNAITSDGRYAAVGDARSSTFIIYDLSTCGAAPDAIYQPVSCKSQDLYKTGFISNHIPGFSGIRYMRFWSENTISFYASYKVGSATKYAQYTLSTKPGPVSKLQYLALGDSYASGEGAFGYRAGTDTDTNHCHQSLYGYPNLLGYNLRYETYHSVACSGAVTNDIVNQDDNYKGQTKLNITRKQLLESGQYSSILNTYSPGYVDQLDFIQQNHPKTITVMIGGNDIGFSSILTRCLELDTCYEWYEDRVELVNEINNLLLPRLVNTYQKVKNQSDASTQIYAIGYPQIIKLDGDCGNNVRLNAQETEFSEGLIDYLDSVIETAAKRVGVHYIDTQDALNGFRLCETEPNTITAVNGITAGNDRPNFIGIIGAESYHPTKFGHLLMEQTIREQIPVPAQPMPAPDPSAMPPATDSLEFLKAEPKGRPLNQLNYNNDLSDNVIYRNGTWNVAVKGSKLYGYYLKNFTIFRFVLHSDEVDLGSATTDEKGNLAAQVHIPADAPLGYHELHILGKDIDGQTIDIYKTVFIADQPVQESPVEQKSSPTFNSDDSTLAPANSADDPTQAQNESPRFISLAPQQNPTLISVPGNQNDDGKVLAETAIATPAPENKKPLASGLPATKIWLIAAGAALAAAAAVLFWLRRQE